MAWWWWVIWYAPCFVVGCFLGNATYRWRYRLAVKMARLRLGLPEDEG